MSSSQMPTPSADTHGSPPARRFLTGPWPAVIVGLLCYLSSLGNDFSYDDIPIVRDNPRIRAFVNIPEIWLTDWWLDPQAPIQDPSRDRLYRPLSLQSFALNYAAHGLHPFGYHLVNVLLHAAACWLVWRLTLRLCGARGPAALAALLFAVHPVHAEAVAGVVGRAEILAALLMMAGLYALTCGPPAPTPGRIAAAAAAFLGALFAKETAICYLPVALLALYASVRDRLAVAPPAERPATGWWVRAAVLLLVPLMIYLPMRIYALEARLLRDDVTSGLFNPVGMDEPLARVLGPFTVLGHYTRLMIAPAKLSCDYGLAIVDPRREPEWITLLGMLAAAAIVAGLLGLRSAAPRWRQIGLLTAVFVFSYGLISNTVLLIGVSLAERLFYWPSAPLLAAAAILIHGFWQRLCVPGGPMHERAGLLRTLGVLLLVALALRTTVRNLDWRDNETLFEADVATFPRGAHLSNCLAMVVIYNARLAADAEERTAHLVRAAGLLDRALSITPRYPDALRQRGEVYLLEGDFDRARQYFESALALNASDSRAQWLFAQVRVGVEDDARRAAELVQRVEIDPTNVAARLELGRLYIALGHNFGALVVLREAHDLAPDDPDVLRAYGEALLINFEQPEALAVLRRVVELRPDDWETHTNLSRLLAEKDPPVALEHARRANELQPDDIRTQVNLAEAYFANRHPTEALRRFRRIEAALDADSPLRQAVADRIRELERRTP